MKTITTLFALLLLACRASGQPQSTTNLITFTYVNGTNTGNVFFETNCVIPKQYFVLQHAGITNFNELGPSNIVCRLQMNINGTWTTVDTFYPSTTNATVDTEAVTVPRQSIQMRVELVTTNSTGVSLYRQKVQ